MEHWQEICCSQILDGLWNMSEDEIGGASQNRFSEDGNNGAADYEVWKCWARAALVVNKSMGLTPVTLRPVVVHDAGWTRCVGTGNFRYQGSDSGQRRRCLPTTRQKIPEQSGGGLNGRGDGEGVRLENREE